MNKRANRVYWLLFIMIFIIGLSIVIDCIRTEKNKDNNNANNILEVQSRNADAISESTTNEITTLSDEETTETTTIDATAAAQKVKEFYSGQVFMGDSIMSGFATYASKKTAPEWLNNVIFLSKVSWGISSALSDNNGPMYQGKSQNICETLTQIKPERIFINLGINEMNGLGSPGYSIDKLLNKYGELIEGIKTAVPMSKIYIINITPCTVEKETAIFSNATIKEFDNKLKEKSNEWGFVYLDLASEFGDSLAPELSSDKFVHHNDKAYSEVWVPFLEKLALAEN